MVLECTQERPRAVAAGQLRRAGPREGRGHPGASGRQSVGEELHLVVQQGRSKIPRIPGEQESQGKARSTWRWRMCNAGPDSSKPD